MASLLAYFEHNFSPFLWQFSENFGIRYYGLAYVLGFVVAGVLLYMYWKRGRSPFNPDGQADLLFWIIAGTLVGGRLGYIFFYESETLVRAPLDVFKVWTGGMASHGGFLGVIFGTWWAARKHRVPFLTAGDIVATLAPPGLLLGRIANFINGELWGKVTTVPWAWLFPDSAEPGSQPLPRHPSQLYEAALEGLLLMLYTQWRIWRTPVVKEQPGRLAGEFLLGYAIVRVIGEFFREPDAGIPPVLGLNRGAWLSLGLAAIGGWLIVRALRRRAAANRAG